MSVEYPHRIAVIALRRLGGTIEVTDEERAFLSGRYDNAPALVITTPVEHVRLGKEIPELFHTGEMLLHVEEPDTEFPRGDTLVRFHA